jgi:hypothetical protein
MVQFACRNVSLRAQKACEAASFFVEGIIDLTIIYNKKHANKAVFVSEMKKNQY